MTPLNVVLNEELRLLLETWNCHWNIEGPQFSELHKLFEAQYGQLQVLIDEIAERARSLGQVAETAVESRHASVVTAPAVLTTLAGRHESLSRRMREEWIPVFEAARDAGTVDLLTRALQEHDKMAWMLRASAR